MTMKKGYENLPQPLSKEEEIYYIQKNQDGDVEARNTLVEHNMRLVFYIANRYTNKENEEELISIGMIGLIKAVKYFDLSKNIRLSTYAARCIENEIRMYFRQNKKYENETKFEETVRDDGENKSIQLEEVFGTEKNVIENKVEQKEEVETMMYYVDQLPFQEKEIILYRFGIGRDQMKQVDIAKKLDISQSYISRIEKKILKKLKKQCKKHIS